MRGAAVNGKSGKVAHSRAEFGRVIDHHVGKP
jgi:hypothetical protein